MDELKQSVQGAVYEQKDPLLIYKFEAFKLFNRMLLKINKEVARFLMKSGLPQPKEGQPEVAAKEAPAPVKNDLANLKLSRPDYTSSNTGNPEQREQPKAQPIRVEKKVGRNDLCPCGSGKKYKQCHGK
jgi:preprotein translocase subunit SecA